MPQSIIFATNNQNKVKEIRSLLPENIYIITLQEAGINIDIPEPYNTFKENASEKTKVILELTGKDCFSEDTGLEVHAINNEPGVKSARYAGEGKIFKSNIDKLLFKLEGIENRTAQFKTVISLRKNGEEYFFEGICKGHITPEQKGNGGFGYDPIFVPDGDNRTFAEMSLAEKNKYSHRKKATQQLVNFLINNYGKG